MLDLITMLATKSPTFDGVPGGGIPKLTPGMVAGALAGLPRPAYLFIRFAFLADTGCYPELVQWVSRHYGVPDAVGRIALIESSRLGICPYCNGSGINTKRRTECKQCDNGEYQWPAKRVAPLAKMDTGEFRRKYWRKYREVVADLDEFVDDSAEHIHRKLMRWNYHQEGEAVLLNQLHREIKQKILEC